MESPPISQRPKENSRRKLIVGIDVGTTTTSISYSYVTARRLRRQGEAIKDRSIDATQIHAVLFEKDGKKEETPTVCTYFQDEGFDHDGDFTFSNPLFRLGPDVDDAIESNRIQFDDAFWFLKLGLCDQADTSTDSKGQNIAKALNEKVRKYAMRRPSQKEREPGLSIEEVFSELLERLWETAAPQIDHCATISQQAEDCRSCPITLRLTVPSTFNEAQNQKVLRASTRITEIEESKGRTVEVELISEPIAAIAGLLQLSKDLKIVEEEPILVLDAGGGTVDSVVIAVESWNRNWDPVVIREECVGIGACCGSAISNQRFVDLLEGSVTLAFRDSITSQTSMNWQQIKFRLVQSFEIQKKRYKPGRALYQLNCPGLPQFQVSGLTKRGLDFQRNMLVVNEAVMKGCVEPCIDEVIKLAKDQLARYNQEKRKKKKGKMRQKKAYGEVKKIILLGGFSRSDHFVSRLKAEFGGSKTILQPSVNMTTIVSHGAVLSRANFMRIRKPQVSYGYLQDQLYSKMDHGEIWAPTAIVKQMETSDDPSYVFDEKVPDGHSLVITSPHTAERYATGRIIWAFQRGQDIGNTAEAEHFGHRYIDIFSDAPSAIVENLYMSRIDCEDGAAAYDPKNGIEKVAFLKAEIPNAAQYKWPRVVKASDVGEPTEFYEVDYKTRTSLRGNRLSWEIELRSPGGFDDEAMVLETGVFRHGAKFKIFEAFRPRGVDVIPSG